MKPPVSPRTVLFLLATISPLSAQSLDAPHKPDVRPLVAGDLEGNDRRHFHGAALPGADVTDVAKAASYLPAEPPVFVSQDTLTLGENRSQPRDVESVVNLDPLRNPSPYRASSVHSGTSESEARAAALPMGLALISAAYRAPAQPSANADCPAVALSVAQRIKLDPAKVLETVEQETTANPGCACEIVKAAIHAAVADEALVAAIVETAIIAAPESMRMISQCAIAASPESLAGVQAVLARLDPNSGESAYSSKSSKGGAKSAKIVSTKAASAIKPPELPDNLDLPPPLPPYLPPLVYPPPVTDVP